LRRNSAALFYFTKRFDVENESGTVILEVASPIWRFDVHFYASRARNCEGDQEMDWHSY